ncbi:MAG: S1/P1 nuclease [Gammaproteobacteria bacterium]
MLRRGGFGWSAVLVVIASVCTQTAAAYGTRGHLIAGRVAEPLLCDRAADAVSELFPGEDLGEIGLWADRIRGDADFADSAPWHYMNIADGVPIREFMHPPEGDVLWAIRHFALQLSDPGLGRRSRAEALAFLVHFVVDIHQPLHVGLAEDRGGNSVRLQFRGEETNLHRFWDTHAVESSGLSVREYVRELAAEIVTAGAATSLDPAVWAAESQSLRGEVYGFGRAGRAPDRSYVEQATRTTRDRLGLAARRLAGTLNAIFCN